MTEPAAMTITRSHSGPSLLPGRERSRGIRGSCRNWGVGSAAAPSAARIGRTTLMATASQRLHPDAVEPNALFLPGDDGRGGARKAAAIHKFAAPVFIAWAIACPSPSV